MDLKSRFLTPIEVNLVYIREKRLEDGSVEFSKFIVAQKNY